MRLNILKDDRFVLYTDGVIETMDRTGEFFGDDRLTAFIEEHFSDLADGTADRFIEYLSK